MNEREQLQAVLIPLKNLFAYEDLYDEKFVIHSFLVICEERDMYFAFAEKFPYLPAEFCFFFKRVFTETDEVVGELLEAEKVYRAHIQRSKISIDLLREAIFKALLTAVQTKTKFRQQFDFLILYPVVNKKIKTGGGLGNINNCLYSILDSLDVFFGPQDLFVADIKRI